MGGIPIKEYYEIGDDIDWELGKVFDRFNKIQINIFFRSNICIESSNGWGIEKMWEGFQ